MQAIISTQLCGLGLLILITFIGVVPPFNYTKTSYYTQLCLCKLLMFKDLRFI